MKEEPFEHDELLQEAREGLKVKEQEILFGTEVKDLGPAPQEILKEKGGIKQYVTWLFEGGMEWCTVMAKLKNGKYFCFGGAPLRPTEEYYEGEDMEQAIQAFLKSMY